MDAGRAIAHACHHVAEVAAELGVVIDRSDERVNRLLPCRLRILSRQQPAVDVDTTLIGHDVDYGMDLVGGKLGLLTLRKRYSDVSTQGIVRDTLAKALAAMAAIEAAPESSVKFDTSAVTIELFDRLLAPNTEEAFETRCKEIEPIADALYGAGAHTLARIHAEDPRKALSIRVAGEAADLATLIERLGE